MKNKILIFLTLFVFMAAGALLSAPRLTSYPRALQQANQSMDVAWDEGTGGPYPNQCEFIYGPGPLNYSGGTITQTQTNLLRVTPSAEGMSDGVYYCRISPTSSDAMTREFRLYIDDTMNLVNYVSPANNADLSTLSPEFQWQDMAGVPYYSVFVFEGEPEMVMDSDGITLNVNILWAAITDGTSITYGTSDPSGYYNEIEPPPLVQGQQYSWAVIKNFSGTPAMMSETIPSYRKFTVNPAASCSTPVLLSPSDGASMTDPAEVVLSWEEAAGASSYKVMLKRKESDVINIEGTQLVPFWTGETAGTSVTIPADIKLNSNDYEWYVTAIDSAGRGAKSGTRDFYYENTGDFNFEINVYEDVTGLGTFNIPGAVFYIKTTYGANVNSFPFIADNEGMLYYYMEAGDYEVTVKKEGFDTAVFSFNLSSDGQSESWELIRSAYTITGQVVDGSGNSISGAGINAVFQGTTFTATASSASDGSFVFGAGQVNGTWNIEVSKSGYSTANTTEIVPIGEYEYIIGSPIAITQNVNTLSGQVTNDSAQGINGAMVTAEENGNPSNSFSDATDSAGNYSMQLPDGDWIVNVTKSGFVSPPPSAVSLSGGESKTRNFTMTPEANEIKGSVSDSGGGGSMENVLVRAEPSGGGGAVETYTDAFGEYTLSVGTGTFYVNAVKSGYSSDGEKTVNFGTAGGQVENGVDFVMTAAGTEDNADLYIYVSDNATSNDLSGVAVNVDGNEAATTGYSRYGVTDSYGGVTFTALHEGNYDIQLSKTGYTTINSSTSSPLINGSTGTESFAMTASVSTGNITGTAKEGLSGISGVDIEVYAQSDPDTLVNSAVTGASGGYTISLSPGDYIVTASINGYSISPAQHYISLAASGTENASFALSQPSGGTIIVEIDPASGIDMYEDIYNTNVTGEIGGAWPYPFKATFLDEEDKTVQTEFTWSVNPPDAGNITSSGVLTPTADYIGEVSVIAEALGVKGSAIVPVYQYFTPSYPAVDKTVRDYGGFSLMMPSGSASASNADNKFTLKRKAVSSARSSASGKKVISSIYDLTYGLSGDLTFDSYASITMPYTGSYDTDKVKAGKWNTTTLSWDSLGGSADSTRVSCSNINTLGEYSVITTMSELGIPYADFSPNPFSPYNGGVTITYSLESLAGTMVKTTIKVFNVAGKHVATVTEGELRSTTKMNSDVWDGRDKNGNWARNGRYFIQIKAEDTEGEVSSIYSIVLIK